MTAMKGPICDPARSLFGGVDKFPPRVYICIQVYSKRIAGKEPAMLELSAKTNLLEENDYRYSLQDVKDRYHIVKDIDVI